MYTIKYFDETKGSHVQLEFASVKPRMIQDWYQKHINDNKLYDEKGISKYPKSEGHAYETLIKADFIKLFQSLYKSNEIVDFKVFVDDIFSLDTYILYFIINYMNFCIHERFPDCMDIVK